MTVRWRRAGVLAAVGLATLVGAGATAQSTPRLRPAVRTAQVQSAPQTPGPRPYADPVQALGLSVPPQSEPDAATPPPPAPPPPFEARARPLIDLSTIVLKPDDVALLVKTLEDAPSHGFRRNEFTAADLADRLASDSPAVRLAAERELKIGLIRYARAQHGQRVAQESFPKNWGVRPEAWNPDRRFAAAVAEDRLAAWLDDLPPPYPGYQALRKALETYRDIVAKGGWDPIPPGQSPLALGVQAPRVITLRARLAVEDSQLQPTDRPDYFDARLGEAVMRYQLRNGLNPTGSVDRLTLRALNISANERLMQIIANMERWRWVNRDMPVTRIEVNIPAGGMIVYASNRPVLSMRAVAGRPTDQTPMLSSAVESIVVNPPWNVPYAIAQKELWPLEKKHPGYLEAHGFRVLPDGQNGQRLQQMAGPSALGKLKFDFPNAYGVYLHDTPTHSTFATDSRAVSHGCVRLQHPADLAKLLLQNDPVWTPEAIDAAIEAGDTKRIKLAASMPVVILYWTAYIGGGQVSFRPDIYGWDKTLLGLIDAARTPPAT